MASRKLKGCQDHVLRNQCLVFRKASKKNFLLGRPVAELNPCSKTLRSSNSSPNETGAVELSLLESLSCLITKN